MKNIIRPARLAASAFATAALVAGIVASQASAAPSRQAEIASHHKDAEFKKPKLKHGELEIKGTRDDDKITLRLKAGDAGTLEVDVGDDGSADFSFERDDIQRIDLTARDGNDVVRMDESNGAFTDTIQTKLDGGDGNDTLIGGSGVETFLGGDGNDTMDGNRGNDVAYMGAGDDTFIWDPGDGNDTIEGQDGTDTMRFNGANVPEQVDVSANGPRLRFFRQPGNVLMDTDDVERVDFNALGSADVVTVHNLAGTDVTAVNLDLAATLGGSAGDGAADQVIVEGTAGDDTINVSGDSANGVQVSGLAATVRILHSEAANDRLDINTLAGNDTVVANGLAPGVIQLFEDGIPVP